MAPALGGSLADRLASTVSWPRRLAIVEERLTSMAASGPKPDPMVAWVWNRLRLSGGRTRITDLLAGTGHSHRHVATRFRHQVGLTPKAAASISDSSMRPGR
jgi:hypothetical protein